MARRDNVRLADRLPEHYQYQDDGCEVSPSCLRCPLPKCKYDDPGWLKRRARRQRDERIFRLWHDDHVSIEELAQRFGLSPRSVFRVLQAARPTAAEGQTGDDQTALRAARGPSRLRPPGSRMEVA